jgi:hypothetical protein
MRQSLELERIPSSARAVAESQSPLRPVERSGALVTLTFSDNLARWQLTGGQLRFGISSLVIDIERDHLSRELVRAVEGVTS